MAKEKIRYSFKRTLQFVDFEPVTFGVEMEAERDEGESAEALEARVREEAITLFNDIQADMMAAFRKKGARTKTSQGGNPPYLTNND